MKYSKQVMLDEYVDLSDEELENVLLTSDGRGKKNKKKVLEILKERWKSS